MKTYLFASVVVCVLKNSLSQYRTDKGDHVSESSEEYTTTEVIGSEEYIKTLRRIHSQVIISNQRTTIENKTTTKQADSDIELNLDNRRAYSGTTDFQDNLINGYRSLIADIQIRTQKSREDMDTLVSQIKLLMKNEADKAINYMTVYLEQISLYFQVIIHDRKPRNGTYCKESIVKLLGENLQLADENVTLCLALGYQRVQRLPEKLQVHFETLENLKKYSASKLFECQKQQQVGGNCSHESQDLERTVFLYETSPFPVVMAEIAIHGFKEVSDLSVCLKDIISRMMTHSVKVIGDFNRCIHNIEMPKLKYLLKFMKKYA